MSRAYTLPDLTAPMDILLKLCVCITGPKGTRRCRGKRTCPSTEDEADEEYENIVDQLTLHWDVMNDEERHDQADRLAQLSICVRYRDEGRAREIRGHWLHQLEAQATMSQSVQRRRLNRQTEDQPRRRLGLASRESPELPHTVETGLNKVLCGCEALEGQAGSDDDDSSSIRTTSGGKLQFIPVFFWVQLTLQTDTADLGQQRDILNAVALRDLRLTPLIKQDDDEDDDTFRAAPNRLRGAKQTVRKHDIIYHYEKRDPWIDRLLGAMTMGFSLLLAWIIYVALYE